MEDREEAFHHIRRLRDVVEVHSFDKGALRCCVTGVAPSEQRPLGLCWGCGHVVATKVFGANKVPSTVSCPHADCVAANKGEVPFVQLFLPTKALRVAQREGLSELVVQKPRKKRDRE